MSGLVRRFSALLDPISVDAFSANVAGKSHLYIPGRDDKFANVASWEAINRLLEQSSLWTGRLLTLAKNGPTLDPETYCAPDVDPDGHRVMRPVPELVRQQLNEGATIVLNHADGLTPEMAAVSACLQLHFRAPIKCNIYCSWQENQGFATHFDGRDVLVLHIAGKKYWNLYDGVYELPMSGSAYEFRLGHEENERLKGNCIERLEMTPGDLLYIPRGQYHDAIASSDASLHLTFGVVPMLGIDAFDSLKTALSEDALFRLPLPHLDDKPALQAHIDRLAQRLGDIFKAPETAAMVREGQKSAALQEFFSVYNFPDMQKLSTFQVCHEVTPALRSGRDGPQLQSMAIPDWLDGRDYFTDVDFAAAFADQNEQDRTALIKQLILSGCIFQVR